MAFTFAWFLRYLAGELLHDFETMLNENGMTLSEVFKAFNTRGQPHGLNAPELAGFMQTVMPGKSHCSNTATGCIAAY